MLYVILIVGGHATEGERLTQIKFLLASVCDQRFIRREKISTVEGRIQKRLLS